MEKYIVESPMSYTPILKEIQPNYKKVRLNIKNNSLRDSDSDPEISFLKKVGLNKIKTNIKTPNKELIDVFQLLGVLILEKIVFFEGSMFS